MNSVLPVIVVVLPFAAAGVLSLIPSWRLGAWINAGSSTLLFLLACALPWHSPMPPPLAPGMIETHLVLLTSLVAMTTSWYGRREIAALLAARSLDRRGVRLCHVAYQTLVGAILLALMADKRAVTWLALVVATGSAVVMTGAMRNARAVAAASRLLFLCSVGLMLALFGIALLVPRPDLAGIFLLVGYGALAGLVPLHAWLPDAVAEGYPPGATLVVALMSSAPLLILVRLQTAAGPGLLIIGGLVSLLLGAVLLAGRQDVRHVVTFGGTAQLGMIVFAFGIGSRAATSAGWLHMTLLALVRASALQSRGAPALQFASALALALLPPFALLLMAGPTVAYSASLLLPFGAGALLTSWFLLAALPDARRAGVESQRLALAPVWFQLGLVALLALAMPSPVINWFRAMAVAG